MCVCHIKDPLLDVGIMKKGQVSTPTDVIHVDIKPVLPTSSTVVTPTIPSTTCMSIPEVEVTDISPTSSTQGPIPSPDSVQIFKPQSYSQDSLSVSQSRLTVKAYLDYDKKRKEAEIGINTPSIYIGINTPSIYHVSIYTFIHPSNQFYSHPFNICSFIH